MIYFTQIKPDGRTLSRLPIRYNYIISLQWKLLNYNVTDQLLSKFWGSDHRQHFTALCPRHFVRGTFVCIFCSSPCYSIQWTHIYTRVVTGRVLCYPNTGSIIIIIISSYFIASFQLNWSERLRKSIPYSIDYQKF